MKPDRYETIFSDKFEIGELKDTAYYGVLNPLPKALFAIVFAFSTTHQIFLLLHQCVC
jgi:hypothetical protein